MRASIGRAILLLAAAAAAAADYETPPTLHAGDVLAADVVRGDHHAVDDEVTSDGFMNSFAITSDFGEFTAYGERTLILRLHEIAALGELSDLSKSEVFIDAVGEGALRSLKGLQQIATNPVETAKGLPDGVNRFFKRVKHTTKQGVDSAKGLVDDDAKEGEGADSAAAGDAPSTTEKAKETTTAYAKKYFGVGAAQRRWAQKLEVDPYTSNEVLQKALADVAKVDAAGRFATRLAPIPRIPGAKYANTVTALVWTREPWEVVEENSKALLAAGATQEMIQGFFANVAFSPTLQTAFVQAILGLGKVENLSRALEQAQGAESEDEARFFVQGAAMLRWFHERQSPVTGLLAAGERVFVAKAADGRVVVLLPVDLLFWTRELGDATARMTPDLEKADRREIWLAGELSDAARRGLEEHGWKAQPKTAAKMQADAAAQAGR